MWFPPDDSRFICKNSLSNMYSIHPIKSTVRLAFRAILETQNLVRLIGILGILTNSTFNRNTGHLGKVRYLQIQID